MTFQKLQKLIEKYDIPEDVLLMSDSGWECCETDMDGPYYNRERNEIIFVQDFSIYDEYHNESQWIQLC